jgi:hypothetical protein
MRNLAGRPRFADALNKLPDTADTGRVELRLQYYSTVNAGAASASRLSEK